MHKLTIAALGGITAAIGSALCCAGPLVAVAVGLSGAGLAATFEPLRPYFLGGSAALLGSGFYLLHREEKNACEAGKACSDARVRRRMRVTLWVATVVALVFGAFPWWSKFVLT